MGRVLSSVRASAAEAAAPRPGDDLVPDARVVVMDRGFTVDAPPEAVWPWIVQLGKRRAGWYFPRRVERWIPRSRRAIRRIDPRWQLLAVGDVIPDYGGRDATFTVDRIEAQTSIVYRSQRGRTEISWDMSLHDASSAGAIDTEGVGATRVHLRLRLAPVRRRWLAESVGDAFDALTIAGMAAGLRERLGV